MFAFLTALIVIALVALMWRALTKESLDGESDGTPSRPVFGRRPTTRPTTQPIAPDDDPEFLRELGKRITRKRDDDSAV